MSTYTFPNANVTGHQAAMNIAGRGRRAKTAYQDPFSLRAEEIARQAIARADSLGVQHYGPAPAPLEEKRDMIREAIEELLDAIYYLTCQVARLEDLREKLASAGRRQNRRGPPR